ncbi:MAG: aminopeptidase P family N-terminal domain-containing protein, partial [Dehalococcoidia bacterium]
MSSQPPSAYAMFSRGDMERRYVRARELMARRGLDALLVTNEENFQYFTGATGTLALHYSSTRPAVLVFPLKGDPISITGQIITQGMEVSTYIKDLRGYTDILSFPRQMVVEAIRDAGPDIRRVGVELGQEQRMGMPVGDYLGIIEAMPDVVFEDAADIFIYLRMVKTPEEVAY